MKITRKKTNFRIYATCANRFLILNASLILLRNDQNKEKIFQTNRFFFLNLFVFNKTTKCVQYTLYSIHLTYGSLALGSIHLVYIC